MKDLIKLLNERLERLEREDEHYPSLMTEGRIYELRNVITLLNKKEGN